MTTTTDAYYYHAGVAFGDDQEDIDVYWSEHSRRSAEAAVREAKRMARQRGGRPVVEYWSREHGLRPGDVEAVIGAFEVA